MKYTIGNHEDVHTHYALATALSKLGAKQQSIASNPEVLLANYVLNGEMIKIESDIWLGIVLSGQESTVQLILNKVEEIRPKIKASKVISLLIKLFKPKYP